MSSSGSLFLQLDEEKLVTGPESIVIEHVRERAAECSPLGIVRNPDRIVPVIQNIDFDQVGAGLLSLVDLCESSLEVSRRCPEALLVAVVSR